MNKHDLETLLFSQIPLSTFMKVKVLEVNDQRVSLECDLQPNHNHIGTAFGGSLSTMMIFAAYCQLYKIINGDGHVILKSCSMDYIIPVAENLVAVCETPSLEDIETFQNGFNRKGKSKIELESKIVLSDGRTACTMKAELVGVKEI